MTRNIVTGQETNLPNNTPQGELVPTPDENPLQITAASAGAAIADQTLNALQQPQEGGYTGETSNAPIQAVEPVTTPSEMGGAPIQAVQPITSVGLPPWLVNNPNIQPVLPDLPNWREQIRQSQENEALDGLRTEQSLLDLPNTFTIPSPPLLDDATGQRINQSFDSLVRRDNTIRLQSELQRLVDYRPYLNTQPSNNLNRNTAVPGSNRSILRNQMGQGTGEPQDSGNPLVNFGRDWLQRSRTQVEIVGSAARDIWNLVTGGEGSDQQREAFNNLVYEYVLGNPTTGESSGEPINNAGDTLRELGQMFPQTTQRGLEGLQNAMPEPDVNGNTGYRNDWINGYFGEYGRGWVGAFNTGLSFGENLAMAGIYSATDLGVALSNGVGLDLPYIRDINTDWDNSGPLYRFRQAFGGVDLDITNVRDGTGNRYLNFIDPNADTQTQIQQGAAGLALSALFGSGVDDVINNSFRVARVFSEATRRTGDVAQAAELTRRVLRRQDLQRARQSIPGFNPRSASQTTSEGVSSPVVGELPEVSPAAGVVINLDEYTNPLLTPEFSAGNISPAEILQEIELDPLVAPPLPMYVPRSNEEILSLGQQLGIIDPNQNLLTNTDIQRLNQVYGGATSRFGPPTADPAPPPGYINVPSQTEQNNGSYDITELVSSTNENQVISAPGGYRLPTGTNVDEIMQQISPDENFDWTLGEAIDEGLIPWDVNAENAYNNAVRQVYPQLEYGAFVYGADYNRPGFEALAYEQLLDNPTIAPLIQENNVRAVVIGHGIGTIQDPEQWFSEHHMRSWREIVDEFPPGTRIGILSCSVERQAFATKPDTMIILESGNPEYIQYGQGNYLELPSGVTPEDVNADMEMFPPQLVVNEDYPEATIGADVMSEGARWLKDQLGERIENDEVFQEQWFQDLLDTSDLELEEYRRWIHTGRTQELEELQTTQNAAIRQSGEAGQEEVTRLNQMLERSENPSSTRNTISWLLDDAPDSMRGTPQVAREYLENVDSYHGAARGLQELEQNIDDLRRIIVRDSQEITGDGWLVPYGRGYVNSELQTTALYGDVHPGTLVDDLLEPIPYQATGLETGTWYHGTKQQGIDRVNFHYGTSHEWGVGLYLTNDPDYANVASRAARTPNNPVPGQTRLEPNGFGSVYQVQTLDTNLLDANEVARPDVLGVFRRALKETFGDDLAKHWDDFSEGATNGELFFKARELYANRKKTKPLETFMQQFSNNVTGQLKRIGYNGIQDEKRGLRMIYPDTDGRIPMNVSPTQTGIGKGSKLEAHYARRWIDAEVQQAYPNSPVAQAWYQQSRLKFENAMMEDMVKAYVPAANETNKLLDDMLQVERRLEADVIAKHEMNLEDMIKNAPDDAIDTPEFKRYNDTAPDDPCI